MRYDFPAQKIGSKCTTAEYGPLDDRCVTVKNSEIDPKNTEGSRVRKLYPNQKFPKISLIKTSAFSFSAIFAVRWEFL